MKPSRWNFFIKKFTRERVVPTISANVSWEIDGTSRTGLSCLPYRASSKSVRASRFSLELNSWSTRSCSISFSTPWLILAGARPAHVGRWPGVAVSDRGTFGGLSQFEFAGSSTSL